jgi:hypothetical protein
VEIDVALDERVSASSGALTAPEARMLSPGRTEVEQGSCRSAIAAIAYRKVDP